MENTINKTKWALDPAHSEILFKVKHMMIANVKGEFRKFNVEVGSGNEDFSKSTIRTTIDSSSVTTNSADRDTHLKSVDFFDVENFGEMTFSSTSFTKKSGANYQLTGDLSIKGVTKEVTFDAEFGGFNKDPWGNERAGFSVTGKVNRKDWGLNWNAMLESGGVLVSDDVHINAEVQFVKQS